jgi:hypothetical protein
MWLVGVGVTALLLFVTDFRYYDWQFWVLSAPYIVIAMFVTEKFCKKSGAKNK